MDEFFKKLAEGRSEEEAMQAFRNHCLRKKLTLVDTHKTVDEIEKELTEIEKLKAYKNILEKVLHKNKKSTEKTEWSAEGMQKLQ